METIDVAAARRLALARAGLLRPEWTGLPARASGRGARARRAALEVIRRFGYLQLDTVSVAGARSHAIVLHSRLPGMDPGLAEELLQPGEPLFEYWGHAVCWLPIELYPVLGFRRRELRARPRSVELLRRHGALARRLKRRIRDEGPLRSLDLEGPGSRGWWDLKLEKRVAIALWSAGELAIRERRSFQRSYDLTERVIPEVWREARAPTRDRALEALVLKALDGHGWAPASTLARTWSLPRRDGGVDAALARLERRGDAVRCALLAEDGARASGWIRPEDLELAERLRRVRPRDDRGVLLSPFDPVLWDRARVRALFGFDQILEIFKPGEQRRYGYYCMPVLAGERLVARVDLKAERARGRLRVLACLHERDRGRGPPAADREAVRSALSRYAGALGLEPGGPRAPRRPRRQAPAARA